MRITVEVKAGSREEGVESLEEGRYLVKVKEPRQKGKANQAVLKLLKKHFGKQARLVSGATSTTKIVEILE
ncbi:MAG: DUF167 domain-containing protein [Candidatus Bathyarchaeota archaeon]|nr:DUF167 domain-containing protein [Candidatus Bathyarchaeota archaeon]